MGSSKSCNSYGFLAAFSAIASAVSWFLVKSKGDECLRNFDKLQLYHLVGVVAGIIICVASLFAIASLFYDITPVLNIICAVAIMVVGGILGYSAWYSFWRPCMPVLGFLPGLGLEKDNNVFAAEDPKMIGVFILDVIAALLFFSTAANFSRRT